MKISFAIGPRERNIAPPETFDISYDDHRRGHICSVMVYGDINKPQIMIVPPTPLPAISISRYWFFMNISWSNMNGFEFNQYSDPEITASINSTPLNSNVGTLRGSDQIKINNGLLALTFKADVDQADLDGSNKPKNFLETCSKFGIRVTNINFLELRISDKLSCARSQLYNVNFINSELEKSDFNESRFTNVQFINSNLDGAVFTNSIFSKAKFSEKTNLRKSVFDKCKVAYDKSRIENDETLIFTNCDLTESTFVRAIICGKLEDSNLSSANFSEAKLVACKFYNCTLNKTIFTKSMFVGFGYGNNAKKPNTRVVPLITCCIGPKPELAAKRENIQRGTIINCKFDSASMEFIDFSNNEIKDTDFEAANLSKAKLYNCEFFNTTFTGKTLKSANLSDADISCSEFKEACNLNEVDLTRVRMIDSKVKNCQFVRSIFYYANLRNSIFIDSNLTGVDFRNADLTIVGLDKCQLNGANFYQTKRGRIDLKLNMEKSTNKKGQEEINVKSSCFIDFVEWSPRKDGEIQINEKDFLMIVSGITSPITVLSRLSKDNPLFISNVYNEAKAEANAKSAGQDFKDASVKIGGNVNESDINGGSIETQPSGIFDEEEEEIRDNLDTNDEESYSENEQQ